MATLATWADYESTSYGFAKMAKNPFDGLSCPILMAPGETQTVKIKLMNTTERKLTPSIKTEVSTSLTPDTELEFFELEPGKSLQTERTIGPENIDLGYFIFAKALVYSSYPLPDQENTCGVFILPFGENGAMILIVGTMISLLCLVTGYLLIQKHGLAKNRVRPLLFIAGFTLVFMLLGYLGWWLPATLMLVLVILTSFITLGILIGQ